MKLLPRGFPTDSLSISQGKPHHVALVPFLNQQPPTKQTKTKPGITIAMTTPDSASKYAAVVTSSADALQERKIQDAQPSLDPVQANGGNWDVAFFGCFSSLVPNCFMSTICPCVAIAQIQARLGNCYVKALYGHGSAMFGLLVCCVLFTTHSIDNQDNQLPSAALHTRHSSGGQQVLFLCGAAFFYLVYAANVCHLRARVRKEFQIDGNCGNDCVVAICCPPCAIAQMASQTQSYTPGSCSFRQPRVDALPGYPATPPMAFA